MFCARLSLSSSVSAAAHASRSVSCRLFPVYHHLDYQRIRYLCRRPRWGCPAEADFDRLAEQSGERLDLDTLKVLTRHSAAKRESSLNVRGPS